MISFKNENIKWASESMKTDLLSLKHGKKVPVDGFCGLSGWNETAMKHPLREIFPQD